MAFTMYSYFNSTTGDLVISGQEESLGEGYVQLDTPETNPTTAEEWPWYSQTRDIKTVHVGASSPIDMTSMHGMFSNCKASSIDLHGLNTSNVIDMADVFSRCTYATSIDVSSFNTSSTTTMTRMFWECRSLKTLNVDSFDTSSVTRFDGMFAYCESLKELDVASFNTKNATHIDTMFNSCSLLKTIDLSSFALEKVTSITNMFQDCSSVTSISFPTSITSGVTAAPNAFSGCSSLTSLDLSSFDLSKIVRANGMFSDCSSLHIIDIPTTATNIVSELPKDTYYDIVTGTRYAKADIPGGSTYVDDEYYVTSPAGIIHTRQGMHAMSRTINDRISSLQNHRRILESKMSGDRVYVVGSADADQSVTGETVVAPCLLIVNGGGGTSMTYRE